MTEGWLEDAEQDSVHDAAADWLIRLQAADLSVDDTIAWQSWMTADERHARAFRRLEETWNRFDRLSNPVLFGTESLDGDRYDGSMPVSHWIEEQAAAPPRAPSVVPRWIALAASVAALGIGAASMLYFNELRLDAATTVVETSVGENRSVRLADGSSIEVGGHTRLEVSMSASERNVTLSHGEAYFLVAKDASRPFSVSAGSVTVTALGTQFNVRRADDRVSVAVVEGRVRVDPRVPLVEQLPFIGESDARRRPYQLPAGSKSVTNAGGLEVLDSHADTSAATAWQTGWLHFDREPLRYVLDDVNRYAVKPIVLDDATLGELKITGAASSNNIEGWLSSVASAFGLAVVNEPDRFVVRRNSGKR